MRNVKPQYSFRSRYGYCNMGFVTAGEIVSMVTDTTWENFLKYHFFMPLNMKRTTTSYSAIVSDSNAAKPYTVVENKLTRIDYANIDNIGPCASINSSIKDISNWIMMQLDSGKFNGTQVFPYSVIKQTQTSNMIVREPSGRVPSSHFVTYGLGWQLEDMYGVKVISHNGGANGFVTNVTLIPEWKTGFVILTNTDANALYVALRQQLIDALANQPYKNVSEVYFTANEKGNKEDQRRIDDLRAKAKTKIVMELSLDKYQGKYKNEVYGEMEIKKEKSGLVMLLSHHPRVKGILVPTSASEFMCTYSDPTYGIHSFPVKIENGAVKSITVKVNDFVDYLPYEFIKTN
jgi:CubicO group peptidase (beta-lactamase class C family)